MKIRPVIIALSLLAALAGGFAIKSNLRAHAVPQTVNVAEGGVALSGYDVVAYSTAGTATPGKTIYRANHDGAVYRFASRENLLAFEADAPRYLPAYGGYCAYGIRMGRKLPIDPTAFETVDGQLYVFLDRATRLTWEEDQAANIQIADKIWPDLADTEAAGG